VSWGQTILSLLTTLGITFCVYAAKNDFFYKYFPCSGCVYRSRSLMYLWATYNVLLIPIIVVQSCSDPTHTHTHTYTWSRLVNTLYRISSLHLYLIQLHLLGPPTIVTRFCSDGGSSAGTVTRKIRGRSVTRFLLPRNTNDLVVACTHRGQQ